MDVNERVVRWAHAKWMENATIFNGEDVEIADEYKLENIDFSRSTVEFETRSDGYCETCYHEYSAIVLRFFSKSKPNKRKPYEVEVERADRFDGLSLADIIAEMSEI